MRHSSSVRNIPLLALACAVSFASLAAAHSPRNELRVTGPSPFADCVADFPDDQGDSIRFTGSEVEPFVVVNPRNKRHLVGIWQQDRWNNGAARGQGVAVSFNRGRTWQVQPMPDLTLCTGGEWVRASDPWLSFGPTGDLFQMALVSGFVGDFMTVQKSVNGGLTWGAPIVVGGDPRPIQNDKNALTADPTDSRFVYAVWDRVRRDPAPTAPTLLARSVDGGDTFEPPRVIFDTADFAQTIGNQVVVLPNGTVVNFFNHIRASDLPPGFTQTLSLIYSQDHGATWLPEDGPIEVAEMVRDFGVVDPDTGAPVRDGGVLFDVAVAPDGTLYAVWQDSLLGDFQHEAIAFSQSVDSGFTWSEPMQINRTPTDIPLENQDAFLPSVEVNRRGWVGVIYYDFRFDGDEPEALTDVFAITCKPHRFGPDRHNCDRAENWSGDLRLTETSFDLLASVETTQGLFVGDYVGLTASQDFHAFYSAQHDDDFASVFHRRFRRGPRAISDHPDVGRTRSAQAFPIDERVTPPFVLELSRNRLPERIRLMLEAARPQD